VEIAPHYPVPVFPLPRVVLFPHTVVPLHVFELRYRTMVREALSAERVIALAQLKPGYEQDYYGSPPIYDVGCLARFEEVEWLPNDCYDIKVRGISRVRFLRFMRDFPYRSALLEMRPQAPYAEDDPLVQIEKRALAVACGRWMAEAARVAGEKPPDAPSDALRYEALVNAACMLLGRAVEEQRSLFEMDSVVERGRRIRELMEARLARGPSRGGGAQDPPRGDRN
jgi:Lon protease-like protein